MSKLRKPLSRPSLFFHGSCAKRLNRRYAGTAMGLADMASLVGDMRRNTHRMDDAVTTLATAGENFSLAAKSAGVLASCAEELAKMAEKLTAVTASLEAREHCDGNLLKEMDTRLRNLEKTIEARIPYRHNDIRKAMEIKTAWQCADFILENMQEDGVPFPWRTQYELLRYSLSLAPSDGMILEFGVYQAKTIRVIGASMPDRIIYGFDSFSGLPETWRPGFEKGTFMLEEPPAVPDNVKLVQGLFEESLPDFMRTHAGSVAFLHVDCDLYSSAKYVLSSLAERIVPGTIILFDEFYNYVGYQEGEFKAFSEFIKETGRHFAWLGYGREQVAVVMK